jgi:hypothetical protein
MKSYFYVLCSFFCLPFTTSLAQEIVNTASKAVELKDLYDQYMGYYDQIDDARSIVKSLEDGKKPNKKFGKWESIAFGLRKAINNMNDYKFIDPIEKDTIPLSSEDFFDCTKKEDNLKKLQIFESNINQSIAKNTEILDEITKYEAAVDSASNIIFYLIDVHGKLAQLPVYKEIAQWDWLEFETGVRPEMDELLSVLRRKKKEFSNKLEKSKGNLDNLQGNLPLIKDLICGAEGTYSGSCMNSRDESMPVTLTIEYERSKGYHGSIKIQLYEVEERIYGIALGFYPRNDGLTTMTLRLKDPESDKNFNRDMDFSGFYEGSAIQKFYGPYVSPCTLYRE